MRRIAEADPFQGLLALSSFPPIVGSTVGIEAELGDRCDVDHVVHSAAPGPREPTGDTTAG
jgi:hypothetical protein